MNPRTVKLSFIIPLYNGLAYTQAMLASLRAHLPAGLSHEIIFADDFSTDATRAWLDTLRRDEPAVRIALNPENRGFAATCNHGASLANGELFAFLNNDLVLTPGWLEPMLALHASLPRPGLIGNVQLNTHSGAVDHSGIFINLKGKPEHLHDLPPRQAHRLVPAVTGACFLISASLWRELRGFDQAYRNGGEDIDLAFRATTLGYVHGVALKSIVHHHISASPGRKLRDEENSRRLALRWQDHLAKLGAPAWNAHFLETQLSAAPLPIGLHDLAGMIAFYLGVCREPPAEARLGMRAAINRELARWDRILGPAGPL